MQDHSELTIHRSRSSEHFFCAISYVTILPAVVMLLVPSTARNSRIRFHACQSILLNWLLMSLAFFLHLRAGFAELVGNGHGRGYDAAAKTLCMALWAFASICVATGREFRIPLLSTLAEKQSRGLLFQRFIVPSHSAALSADPASPAAVDISVLSTGSRLRAAVVRSAIEKPIGV